MQDDNKIVGAVSGWLARLVGFVADFLVEFDRSLNRLAREIAGTDRRIAENRALEELEANADSFDVKIEMTPFGRKVTIEAKGVKCNPSNKQL